MGRVGGLAAGRSAGAQRSDRGFSLIEVVIAMGILTVGILSLVAVLTAGVRTVAGSSSRLIAREKAREAVESVHAARDTGQVSWGNIRNVADGGIFLGGAQPLKQAGTDGIVNTMDDASAPDETQHLPGYDGTLGTGDDIVVSLVGNFTREVLIEPILDINGNASTSLRRVTVTIRYRVDNAWLNYTLSTFVSSFS